jgi:hypothetical protein
MPEHPNGRRSYEIHGSGVIADAIREIQRRAEREGRGSRVLAALRLLRDRLRQDPNKVGEPLYRLAALRLQIRTVVIGPLAVDFGVHEVHPLVFIKGVTLLSKP